MGYAILAALGDGQAHAYMELVGYMWQVWREQGRDQSSVWYAIKGLEEVGAVELVEGLVPAPGASIARYTYRITDEGRRLLQAQREAWEVLLRSATSGATP